MTLSDIKSLLIGYIMCTYYERYTGWNCVASFLECAKVYVTKPLINQNLYKVICYQECLMVKLACKCGSLILWLPVSGKYLPDLPDCTTKLYRAQRFLFVAMLDIDIF